MRKIALAAVVLAFVLTSAGVGTAHALGQTDIASITTDSKLAPKKETTKVATKAKAAAKAVVAPVEPAAPVAPAPVIVTVQSGDSLSKIAQANGTTYERVFDANDSIADPNVIHVGQQLRIPAADEQLPDRTPAVVAAAAPVVASTPRRVVQAVSYPAVAGSDAKAFIYSHESGNNPNATNPKGCYGLGQDCNGRVRALCGADYACQDEFFTNYAMSRYGSWENAVAFWQAHRWW